MKLFLIAVLTLFALPGELNAQAFDRIRIGNADGFGFTDTSDLQRPLRDFGPGPADTDGDGLLEPTEFLPDLNGDGAVWYFLGLDAFDNRDEAVRANRQADCIGCLSIAAKTQGSAWTNLALTPNSPARDWPDINGPNIPNSPTFVFDFTVARDAIVEGSNIFFNLVAADFDFEVAQVQVRFANGNRQSFLLQTPGQANLDGMIQKSTATFAFDDVFTIDQDDNWHGSVTITVATFFEPFTAVDYAELSTFAAVAQIPIGGRHYAAHLVRLPISL